MNTMKIKSFFGSEADVYFVTTSYANNGNLAVQIMSIDEDGFSEPFASLTTNIVDLDKNLACVDENNLYCDVAERLENMGLIKKMNRSVASGFCSYEVFEFTDKFFEADFVEKR